MANRIALALVVAMIAAGSSWARPGYDSSPFGINGLKLMHARNSPNIWENGRVTAKVMEDAGIYWDRLELWWGELEPEKGRFDWSFSDKVAEFYREQDIHGMVILCYSSAWSNAPPADDAERARYANYVYQMVSRYKDTFKVWEIWNEPNIPTFWPEPNVRDYTLMLKEAYKAAKRADPTCTILAASTSGPDLDFIKGVYKYGGWDYCDGISIHPYSMAGGPVSQKLDKILRMHQEYIASVGGRGSCRAEPKSLWITEMGWTSSSPAQDEAQAISLFQSYVISLANGVEKLFWFCLDDWGEKWGIVRSFDPFDPKPSYAAYKVLTQHLGSPGKCAQFEGYLRMPLGVACYVFKKSESERVLILWSSDHNTRTVRFPRRTCSWQATDIFGKPVDVQGARVSVGPVPMIISGVDAKNIGPMSRRFNPYLERPGSNLLTNGALNIMEGDGPKGWNRGRFDGTAGDGELAASDEGRRGSRCVYIARSGKRAAWDAGPIPVDVGKTYRLTGWLKTEGAIGNNQIALFFYSGNMWTYQREVRSENIAGTNDWTKVAVAATVPEGTTFVRVNLISEENAGTTWIDDVTLVEE